MNKNWYNFLSFKEIHAVMLFGSDLSHDDRVDALKMRWIGENLNSQLLAIWVLSGEMCSQMVFDITRVCMPVSLLIFLGCYTLELSKNCLEWFSDDIGKHI